MRIGIDARFFGPEESGLGRYVYQLIQYLQTIDTVNDYVVFLRQTAYDTWRPANPRWKKVLADYRWYTVSEQRHMPQLLEKERLDLVHFPHFNVPLWYHRPYVVTVHDLTLYRFPTARASTLGFVTFWIKYYVFREIFSRAIGHADAIITISQHSKHEISQRFHVPAEHITVTYEAADALPEPVTTGILAAKGVQSPYLLYVGNAYPHKNLERLLQAWAIAHKTSPDAWLVMVGKQDFFSNRLRQWAEAEKIPHIVWFGFASEAELSALYRQAQAYFFPSLSEGFGLPGLEAMTAGTPVFAAKASCLPEVYGDAAHYFDPLNVQSIADSMRTAMYDTLERQRLIAAGRQRLTTFSWERMARQTLEVYQRAHAREPRPTT